MPVTVGQIKRSVLDHHLSLIGVNLTDEDIKIICDYLNQHPEITSLNVTSNKVSDEGAKLLAANTTLRELNLHWNNISDEGAKAFMNNPTLESLNLSLNKISDDGAKFLAANKKLRVLDVSSNKIGDKGAKALAENKFITALDVSNNKIGEEGAKVLEENKNLIELNVLGNNISITVGQIKRSVLDHHLSLIGVNLTDEDIKIICDYLNQHPEITSLNVKSNKISDEGAKLLAANTTLRELNLRWNNISDDGAKAFMNNPTFESLNLSLNKISDDGAKFLAANKSLRVLDVSSNKIGDKGAKALAENKFITELDVSHNNIGEEGTKVLEENKNLVVLNVLGNNVSITVGQIKRAVRDHHLSLIGANLTDEDIKIICDYLNQHPEITSLDVNSNKISNEGAKLLAANTTLRELNLRWNNISDEGAKAFENNLILESLNLSLNEVSNEVIKSVTNALKRNVIEQGYEEPVVFNKFHREFNNTIWVLQEKKKQFQQDPNYKTDPKLQDAYNAANALFAILAKEGNQFFVKKASHEDYEQFKLHCKEHINDAREVLDQHRGWRKIVLNIFAMIITAGIGYAIAAGINIAVKGRFTFFSTDSSEKLADIEEQIENKTRFFG